MNIFKKIFNAFAPSTNKLKSSNLATVENLEYSDILNNQQLSASEFLSVGILSRCVQIIANDIAKVSYIHKANNKRVKNSPLELLLNRRPNSLHTPWEFRKLIIWDLLLWGNAVLLKTLNEQNQIELLPIPPTFINRQIINGKTQYILNLTKDNINENTVIFEGENEKVILDDKSIIWIDYDKIDGILDVKPRSLFKSSINKMRESETNLLNSIKNDLAFSLMIKVSEKTNSNQREQAERSLREMLERKRKTGSIAMVVDEAWEVQNAGNIIDTKIDYSTRNSLGREIASIFGIPPAKLGVEDTNKYNTLVEQNRAYTDDALKPLLLNISQKLTQGLLKYNTDEYISFSPLDLLNLDPNSIREFGASAINNAIATPNEIRHLLGFEPIANGDELMANSAILPVSLNIERAKVQNELNDNKKEQDADKEQKTNI